MSNFIIEINYFLRYLSLDVNVRKRIVIFGIYFFIKISDIFDDIPESYWKVNFSTLYR